MTTKAQRLWDWIDARCAHLGIDSIRELERRSGVSYGAISKPKADGRLPTVELSLRMCKPLMVDFAEFWANSGLVKTNEPTGYLADIILTINNTWVILQNVVVVMTFFFGRPGQNQVRKIVLSGPALTRYPPGRGRSQR